MLRISCTDIAEAELHPQIVGLTDVGLAILLNEHAHLLFNVAEASSGFEEHRIVMCVADLLRPVTSVNGLLAI